MFEEVRRCDENFNKVEKRGLNNIGSSKYENSEEETSSAATTSPSSKSGNDATYAEISLPLIDASTSNESISNLSSGSIGSLLYNTYEPIDLSRALIDMTKEHIYDNYGSSKCESSNKEETSSAATTSTSSTKSGSDETYVSLSSIDASTSKDSISSKSSITNLSSASDGSFFCNNYEPVDSSRPLISVGSFLYNNYEPVDTSRSLIDMTKENIYENYGSLKNMYDKSENVESPLPYAGSPPTYQVCETKDGRLINKTLNIVYPNHPAETKKLFDGYIWKQQPRPQSLPSAPSAATAKGAASSTSTLSYPTADSFSFTTSTSSDLDTTKFIGPATLETVNKKLLSNDFIIFYALPDIKRSTDDNDLPSNLPLRIAFQSSNGKPYYLPIKRKEHQWRIKFPNGTKSKGFLTIQKLIEHCYSFGYLNPSTGACDMFPLNLLENTTEK